MSIAYVLDGKLEMGFVSSPARGELFIGRRGANATLNGRSIRVSAAAHLTDGIVGVGYSPWVRSEISQEKLCERRFPTGKHC